MRRLGVSPLSRLISARLELCSWIRVLNIDRAKPGMPAAQPKIPLNSTLHHSSFSALSILLRDQKHNGMC